MVDQIAPREAHEPRDAGRRRDDRARWFPWAVAVLAVCTLASRIPMRSQYLFAWDSANFALGLDQYNVAFHQPQPPGYPMYVATAWVVRAVSNLDANGSLVTLSIGASGVAVVFVALVGARLYDDVIGVLSGVVLATSSLFWGQGEVAYPYTFLAAFGTAAVWVALRVADGGNCAFRWALGGAVMLAVGSGYRSEIAPFLAPVWAWGVLTWPASWKERTKTGIVASVFGAVSLLTWYIPMVELTGGWEVYTIATGGYYAYFIQATSGVGKQLLGVLENLRTFVNFTYAGLGPAILLVIADLGVRFRPSRILDDRASLVLAIWIAPPIAFYLLVHLGNPGYTLTYLPAAAILVAVGTRDLVVDAFATARRLSISITRRSPRSETGTRLPSRTAAAPTPTAILTTMLIVAVVAATNAALFLFGPGEGRWREIATIDAHFSRVLSAVRTDFPASNTVVVAYDRSRQYRYYLRDWRHELLFDVAVAGAVTDTNRYWEWRRTYRVPNGVQWVIFPDLGENRAEAPGAVTRRDLGGGEVIWVAPVSERDEVTWGYHFASTRQR